MEKFKKIILKKIMMRSFDKNIFQNLAKIGERKFAKHPDDLDIIPFYNGIFDELRELISNKDVIKQINRFLERYYRWICKDDLTYYQTISPKMNARKLLSAYIINYFPEYALDMTQNNLMVVKKGIKYDIFILSRELIRAINGGYIGREFVKCINNYSNAFDLFMKLDKFDKLNDLIIKWYDIDKTRDSVELSNKYDPVEKNKILALLKNDQQNMINFMLKTDPKFDIKILGKYKNIHDKFESSINKAYWDLLEIDLLEDNFIFLGQLLGEIKTGLVTLDPKSKTEYDEILDIEFIQMKIKNKVFHYNEFVNIGDFLVNKIISLQAPIRNGGTADKWESIKRDGYLEFSREKYINIISRSLKFILEGIHEIKNDISILTA